MPQLLTAPDPAAAPATAAADRRPAGGGSRRGWWHAVGLVLAVLATGVVLGVSNEAAAVPAEASASMFDGGAALFSVTGLTPGRAGSNCLTIDYTGDVGTIVGLYAAASTIFSGTLAAFTAAAQDYASGVGSWSPNGAAARVYRVAYTLDAATPSSKQGGVCTVTFRWQSQA